MDRKKPTKTKETPPQILDEGDVLRNLIDLIPDLILIKDREGRYVLINRAKLRELGARTAERPEPGQHREDLRRVAELAACRERRRIGAAALRRREAAVLGVDAAKRALHVELVLQSLA